MNMLSNLPPGVSESDIPGNRPEDELYEKLFEQLPNSIQNEIEKESEIGKRLNENFMAFIDMIFTENDLLQEMKYLETEIRQEMESES